MTDRALPNLPARDLVATRDFYAGFGFVEHYLDDGWMILRRTSPNGTLQLEFFEHPEVDPLSSSFMCTVRVADLDELYGAIAAAGVPVRATGYPRLHEPGRQDWGLRAAFLIDIDGTQLSLVEDPGA